MQLECPFSAEDPVSVATLSPPTGLSGPCTDSLCNEIEYRISNRHTDITDKPEKLPKTVKTRFFRFFTVFGFPLYLLVPCVGSHVLVGCPQVAACRFPFIVLLHLFLFQYTKCQLCSVARHLSKNKVLTTPPITKHATHGTERAHTIKQNVFF